MCLLLLEKMKWGVVERIIGLGVEVWVGVLLRTSLEE